MHDIQVFGDKRRVRQILLNLVGNAIKFTHKGHVRIDVYDESADQIKVAVRDTGIGMKKEDLDVIFERFRQADGSAKRSYEGTGLGLAITKEMVELQKGRIWVESEPNKGTTIYFTMKKNPFEVDKEKTQAQTNVISADRADRQEILKRVPESPQGLKKKANPGNGETILVIDDEAINIETISLALQTHNYKIISAQDGFKGLKEMKAVKPAAVLLDIMMPGMDGFEFCRLAKDDEDIRDIPIMLLTAKVTVADKIEGFNLGADDYMLKPFNSEELIARIQSMLRRSRRGLGEPVEKPSVSKVYELKQTDDKYKEEPRGNGETILVIDDEPINIEVLESRLKFSNYQVIAASDGIKGLKMAEEQRPDLIILDLMMPNMTGYEFCEKIRANDDLKETPLIMLTGKDATADKIYGYNLGADDYMTKPVNKIDLLMRVYALLRTKALQDQLKTFTHRLSELFGVGIEVSSIFHVDELYHIIVNSAQRIFHAGKSVLWVIGENGFLYAAASAGMGQAEIQTARIKIGEGLSGWVAENKQPLTIPSVQNDSRFKDSLEGEFYQDALLSVPFLDNDKVIGILTIERQEDVFTKDDLQILLIFANQAAIAIRNAQLIDQEKDLTQRMAKAEIKAEYVDILKKKNDDLERAYQELKLTQKQLVQSEKMATIGILAGGVAHEINTPLGTILANTEMLKAEAADTFQKDSLGLIERSAISCKKIIENLLNYSRKSQDTLGLVDVQQSIEDAFLLMNNDPVYRGIAIEKQYEEVPEIQGNANELTQVFMNIVINAMHAVRKAHQETIEQGKIHIHVQQMDHHVCVEVKDNGCGISHQHRNMIFDPFFTTKDVNEGTGLGLSVVHNIIEKHGGAIEVESEEGRGATFRIQLPMVQAG